MSRIFILASGPSLEGFDFHRLDGEVTLGLNFIFRYYTPTILHWLDHDVYHNNRQIIDKMDCIKVTKKGGLTNTTDVYGVQESAIKFHGEEGLQKGIYHKFLAGLTALSLAIALKFKPIYLLGYDCAFKDGQGHFYSKDFKHKGDKREHVFKIAIKLFDVYRGWSNIYNCSSISQIKVFPQADIDSVLAEERPMINKEGIKQEVIKALKETGSYTGH